MGGRIPFTKESHRIVVGLMGSILSNVDRTNSSRLGDADRGYAPEPLIALERLIWEWCVVYLAFRRQGKSEAGVGVLSLCEKLRRNAFTASRKASLD